MTPARTETALIVLVNGGAIALLAWLGLQGRLLPLLDDAAHLTPVLAALALAGVALSWWRFAEIARGCADQERRISGLLRWAEWMTILAILGTAIGFSMALAAMGVAGGDPNAKIAGMMAGLSVSLHNTIVGSGAWAWIMLDAALCETAASKLRPA